MTPGPKCEEREPYEDPDMTQAEAFAVIDALNAADPISWLLPHLEAVLRRRLAGLAAWRRQCPSKNGQPKDFERWLQFELVEQLQMVDFAEPGAIRTGGQGMQVVAPRESTSNTWSADLFVTDRENVTHSAELKVGVAQTELVKDLRRVRRYYDTGVSHRSELGWVVLVPDQAIKGVSRMKSYCGAWDALRTEAAGRFHFKSTALETWLLVTVAIPRPPQVVPPANSA